MLAMTASLHPLVKETWPLASVHGPGLLAFHTCIHICVCVSERDIDRENGKRLVMLVF